MLQNQQKELCELIAEVKRREPHSQAERAVKLEAAAEEGEEEAPQQLKQSEQKAPGTRTWKGVRGVVLIQRWWKARIRRRAIRRMVIDSCISNNNNNAHHSPRFYQRQSQDPQQHLYPIPPAPNPYFAPPLPKRSSPPSSIMLKKKKKALVMQRVSPNTAGKGGELESLREQLGPIPRHMDFSYERFLKGGAKKDAEDSGGARFGGSRDVIDDLNELA